MAYCACVGDNAGVGIIRAASCVPMHDGIRVVLGCMYVDGHFVCEGLEDFSG